MKMKNLISLLLSVVMVLGMAAPAMADELVSVPATLSELEGYEKLANCSGADLYVNKETGDVNFVLGDKVLFTEQKANKPQLPKILPSAIQILYRSYSKDRHQAVIQLPGPS